MINKLYSCYSNNAILRLLIFVLRISYSYYPILAVSSSVSKKLRDDVCVGSDCSICFVCCGWRPLAMRKHFGIAVK
jgi:hypothetical protein